MSLTVRPLQDSDYDSILVKWWRDWEWEPTPKDFLPQDGTGGLMVMDGDEPVCAGFVYTTNSSVAWADWIVSSRTTTAGNCIACRKTRGGGKALRL